MKNLVILLFNDSDLLGTLRLNLNIEECVKSINAISENHQPITLRFWQGSSLEPVHNLFSNKAMKARLVS